MKARLLAPLLMLAFGVTLPGMDPNPAWPLPDWSHVAPKDAGLDEAKLAQARDYALTGGGSGCVIRGDRLVFSWGDPKQRFDLKSTTKSFGAAALGLAIKDGKVRLTDKARAYHPTLGTPPDTNADTGWLDEITLLHLASQTAGFDKPGGYVPLLFKPGTEWAYSDSGPNWLAECLTLAYRRDLDELMFERIFTPLGIHRTDLVWRKNQYRPDLLDGLKRREFGAGISANVDGILYLLVRNAGNAQLGWSADHGSNWTWADWKFTESFGCPTFLNFGRDYAGARDGSVYVYSHDRTALTSGPTVSSWPACRSANCARARPTNSS